MYDTIYNDLRELMADELVISPEEIIPQANLVNDLGINSLELMNIIMVAEERFDVFFEEEKLRNAKTVDDVVYYLIELKS